MNDYILPDGTVASFPDDLTKGAAWISFTLASGRVVWIPRADVAAKEAA